MNGLNERQRALYAFLLEQGDKWTFQEDIAYSLGEWYCPVTSGDFHNTRERYLMTQDIRIINECPDIQKIIISNPSRGIKLATEAEWKECIKREYISVFKKLKRIRQKENKGKMHGQSYVVYDTEQDVINAFLKEA